MIQRFDVVYRSDLFDWMQRHPILGRIYAIFLIPVLPVWVILWHMWEGFREEIPVAFKYTIKVAFGKWH